MAVLVEYFFQATRVVVVAVADYNHINGIQGNPQLLGVMAKHFSLPRIEEDIMSVGFYP